jgi:hypothetical protein
VRPSQADLSIVLEQVPVPESDAASIVRAWAAGQRCVSCSSLVSEPPGAETHVALLDPNGVTREWVDIGADRLTLALATSLPVCWNCHVSATFRRLHPELVTDRGDWPSAGERAIKDRQPDDRR